MSSVKSQFADCKALLDQVHGLVDGGTPADISKAASLLKSILPIYKDLNSNEESKRPENLEVLKEIKIRLAEETQRVMTKKEESKKYQDAAALKSSKVIELSKPALLQGYLKKQGEKGIVKGFKKRWFQQKDTKLYYYEKEGDTNSYGFINLPDMLGVKTVDQGFELATPTRVYVLQVLKPSDLSYWTEGLKEYKKYYSSLSNNQKFGLTSPSGEISIAGGDKAGSGRPLAQTMSSAYLQDAYVQKQGGAQEQQERRGTVSASQFNRGALSRDDLDEDRGAQPQQPAMSSSYNPTSSIDEGLKKREEELRKRFLEQKQQEEEKKRLEEQGKAHEEERKKVEREHEQREQREKEQREEQSRLQREAKEREQEEFRKQEEERDRERQLKFQQQEEEINKRLSLMVETTVVKESESTGSNAGSPSVSSAPSNRASMVVPTPVVSAATGTSEYIDMALIKKRIEEDIKKEFLVQQDQILEIERQRRTELERELKRVKDLLASHQGDNKFEVELQISADEIERLKKELRDSVRQAERLERENKELTSIKPQEKFSGQFKWIEEMTARDKQILSLQSKVRELDETVRLNENAVSSIQRENEILREETEKKDRYITELIERSKESGSGSMHAQSSQSLRRGSVSMDVSKLKEALSAHQSQNQFLMAEINKLENDSQLKLVVKTQQIDELQKQLEESINQFHSFRNYLLGVSMPADYISKIESENLDIKKEYFLSLGLSIKLHRARDGQNSNIDVHSLYEEATKDNIPYKQWPEWLSTRTSK